MPYNFGQRSYGRQNYNLLGRGQVNTMMPNARPDFDMMNNPNIQGPGGANVDLAPKAAGTNWAGIAGMLGNMINKSNEVPQAAPMPMPQQQPWGGFQMSPWMQRYMKMRGGG